MFDSSSFPAQNPGLSVLTLMLGGEHQLHVMDLPEAEIAARAMRHLTYHTTLAPDVTNVTKWHNAIPQYTVGHHARVAEVEEIIKVTSITKAANAVTLVWESKAGVTYDIFASNTLQGDPLVDWDKVSLALPSDGDDTTDFTENFASGAPVRRFYKIREVPAGP